MSAAPAGFCSMTIGDLRVTFVPDGVITDQPANSYPHSAPELWAQYPEYLDHDGRVVMSLGALVLESRTKVGLVDLGWGPGSFTIGDGTGHIAGGDLLVNLAQIGVEPGDVDVVLFSHLHRDHTGWLIDPRDGSDSPRALFERAEHLVSEAELSYWSSAPSGGPGPNERQLGVLSDRLGVLEDGATVFPGVTVVATPGHTPGHCSFLLASGTERAVVLGDAVHCPVEILEPELAFALDVDPGLAQRTRAHLHAMLQEGDALAVGPHFPDLVFGRLLQLEGRASWNFAPSQRSEPNRTR